MNQPNYILSFDQTAAERAGGASFDGGAHSGKIAEAKYVTAKSGTKGIELKFVSDGGQEFNYLTMYYSKSDNTPVKSGVNCLNAIMYFSGIPGITARQQGNDYICPELIGKRIGLFLQKRLYTKNDGSDGFDFSIRAPFAPDSRHTVKEATNKLQPVAVASWIESYADVDERNKAGVTATSGGNGMPDFDDIPY